MDFDYVIVGAGATGLSFLDTLLTETEANVAIVDRRSAPGGHWNDAYPFVRLHQDSAFYGVSSRELGAGRKSTSGYNKGLMELASRSEILHYFHNLMEHSYLPTGRVQYFPMSEYAQGEVRSLLTGDVQPVAAGKVVNAGIWGDLTTIPSTHTRPFETADGVACVAVNDLPRYAPGHENFCVLGAGKTAMDAILWLLSHGVDPDRVTWVKPNDYWLFCRDFVTPHPDFFEITMESLLGELRSLATALSLEEHELNLEACGRWHRIDATRRPTRFHAAMCSKAEVAALRRIDRIIRAGRVRRITPDRLELHEGEAPVAAGTLFVDCTAHGGAILGKDHRPVFDGDEINLFMVRPFQPLFSAALIAFLEARVPDPQLRAAATRVTDFHDVVAEYLPQQANGFLNQGVWNQSPEIKAWMDQCRLNAPNHLMAGFDPADAAKRALVEQIGPLTRSALENIPRILAAA